MNDVCISNVAISKSNIGLTVKRDSGVKINNCHFVDNVYGLQLVSASASVTVTNSQFHRNGYGINLVDRGKLAIRGCRFTHQTNRAIRGTPGNTRHRPETVVISDNVFAGDNSMKLRLSGRTNLRLVGNTFERNHGLIYT